MKILSLSLFLSAAAPALWCQTPDCQFATTFTSATRSAAFPAQSTATGNPCVSWRVTYQAVNMSAVSVELDGSPDNGSSAPTGAWVALGPSCPGTNPCTVLTGTNPMTDPAESNLQVLGYYPWISVNVGTYTSSGTPNSILVKIFGYRGSTPSPAGGAVTFSGSLPAGSNTIGKVDILGNAGAILDAPGQNAVSPPNWVSIGCQFNTAPTTITSGNGSPCQVDNSGNTLTKINAPLPAGGNTIGKTNILGNTGAVLDAAGQNATPPANWLATGCQFNTVPTTITNGNGSPCQTDNVGNALTKINAPLPAGGNIVGKVQILGNSGCGSCILDALPGAAAPPNALQMGFTDGANLRILLVDPCQFRAFNYYVINVAVNTQIVAGVAAQNVYVCQFFLAPVASAANVNIVESSTSGNACATSPTGMMGGATAATGATLATNGGFVLPFAGGRAFMKTATAGDAMCIFTSATVTGVLSWVQF